MRRQGLPLDWEGFETSTARWHGLQNTIHVHYTEVSSPRLRWIARRARRRNEGGVEAYAGGTDLLHKDTSRTERSYFPLFPSRTFCAVARGRNKVLGLPAIGRNPYRR